MAKNNEISEEEIEVIDEKSSRVKDFVKKNWKKGLKIIGYGLAFGGGYAISKVLADRDVEDLGGEIVYYNSIPLSDSNWEPEALGAIGVDDTNIGNYTDVEIVTKND